MLTQTRIQASSSSQAARRVTAAPVSAVHDLGGPIEMMGAVMPFIRSSEIYGQDEPADYLYKVVTGTVRTYKILTDGRRQIGSFYLPGDIFGLEVGDEHTFSAEAIADSRILVIKRSSVMALAARDHDVARQLWTFTACELQRVRAHSAAH